MWAYNAKYAVASLSLTLYLFHLIYAIIYIYYYCYWCVQRQKYQQQMIEYLMQKITPDCGQQLNTLLQLYQDKHINTQTYIQS